jgi:hypothetical protein
MCVSLSFGGGVRRLANMSYTTAYILEVVFYGKRGVQLYDTRDPEGGTAETNCEPLSDFVQTTAHATLSAPPCSPSVLFRHSEYVPTAEEAAAAAELQDSEVVLLRGREGDLLQGKGSVGPVAAATKLGSSLSYAVGGLDAQLDEIVRRVLATRALPAHVRQALGVSHCRGLLLYGPPGNCTKHC